MKVAVGKKQFMPLSKIVSVPPKSFPSASIEHDEITSVNNYLPSASALEIVERFSAGLAGAGRGRMLSVTGPYGSGKSTMATFLGGLVSPQNGSEWKSASGILKKRSPSHERKLADARKKSGIHDDGMIRCTVMARREPISATILRALDDGFRRRFGSYGKKKSMPASTLHKYVLELKENRIPDAASLIKLIEDIARIAPIIMIIDEFGKSIEYFAGDASQQSDLFLLQELAEKSGRHGGIPLFIITLQHMAFEEYAVGTSVTQRREWAKIQGRFDDIPFANSPDQTRLLVSRTIKRSKDASCERAVLRWAKKESAIMRDLGIATGSDPDTVAACYPLGPLALEVLPELCSRYGQHERTLMSFVSDRKRHTISTFIDEQKWDPKSPPAIGLDMLYDYFISGTGMAHSSSSSISRLMEVETIIRDAHGLTEPEKKTLKVIGMLNLIGRSGYLRASRRMIDYAVGNGSTQALDILEKKSIITYRKHADEYRVWHGSDIDIANKLEMYRKRCQHTPLLELLKDTIRLEPVVAAKHGIETGTMRLFERCFESHGEPDENYDGVILYITDIPEIPSCKKPVIAVTAQDTADLRLAAVEAFAIRDILDSDEDIRTDWVVRRELEERLAYAEVALESEFARSYGNAARWMHKSTRLNGTPSMMVSEVCRKEYDKTPVMRNEVINRTALSAQGSTAKKKLLEAMITRHKEPKFGIEGYGPERAIYEAVFYENGIHTPDSALEWHLNSPKDAKMVPVWDAMLGKIKHPKSRVPLVDVYGVAKMPPYGVKDGPVQLLVMAMILLHRGNIALYEHGTFMPRLQPEAAERMTKNPEHFELKYFQDSRKNKNLLGQTAAALKLRPDADLLEAVGHIVRTISALPPHIKTTKRLDKATTAVRDTVLTAREPDTLLFDSLPKALGYGTHMSNEEITQFSKVLAKSVRTLQGSYEKMLEDMCTILLEATGMKHREKISEAAKAMLPGVSDQKMKVFLGALSADTLEKTDDWINYVAMSLTDMPPADWKDEHRDMFENRLREESVKFSRLAGVHFAQVSDSFSSKSWHVAITRSDGHEQHKIVSLDEEQQKKARKIIAKIRKELKKEGIDKMDINAVIAAFVDAESK